MYRDVLFPSVMWLVGSPPVWCIRNICWPGLDCTKLYRNPPNLSNLPPRNCFERARTVRNPSTPQKSHGNHKAFKYQRLAEQSGILQTPALSTRAKISKYVQNLPMPQDLAGVPACTSKCPQIRLCHVVGTIVVLSSHPLLFFETHTNKYAHFLYLQAPSEPRSKAHPPVLGSPATSVPQHPMIPPQRDPPSLKHHPYRHQWNHNSVRFESVWE